MNYEELMEGLEVREGITGIAPDGKHIVDVELVDGECCLYDRRSAGLVVNYNFPRFVGNYLWLRKGSTRLLFKVCDDSNLRKTLQEKLNEATKLGWESLWVKE